ncbi:MAG: trehalose-phosphatase [Rhizobiaceae bacterium]
MRGIPQGTTRADPLSDLDPGRTAFFLDFDGTLAPIVARPDEARIEPAVLDVVHRLQALTGGAVAILSGRAVDRLDRFLAPLVLPAAGVHGLQRRDAAGVLHEGPVDRAELTAASDTIDAFANPHLGLIVERKPASIALHYRQRPDLEPVILSIASRTEAAHPGLHLLRGKCVVELKAGDRTKGDALADFMREPPFAGRTPVVAGDDVTDEAAFAAANRLGGRSIKVGDGTTAAAFCVSGPHELHTRLLRLAERWDGGAV